MDAEALRAALRELFDQDPALLDELLGDRYLRNPCPPSAAGDRLRADPTARVSPQAHLELLGAEATVSIGARTEIDHFAWLRAWGQGIVIGADCTLHQYSMVQGGVVIGDGVRIGAHTLFVATDHRHDRLDLPIYRQGTRQLGITVADDCYIGSNVVILDGVTVGEGAVIAAGAVVREDVPPRTVVGGVPARVLKRRGETEGGARSGP